MKMLTFEKNYIDQTCSTDAFGILYIHNPQTVRSIYEWQHVFFSSVGPDAFKKPQKVNVVSSIALSGKKLTNKDLTSGYIQADLSSPVLRKVTKDWSDRSVQIFLEHDWRIGVVIKASPSNSSLTCQKNWVFILEKEIYSPFSFSRHANLFL